MRQRESYGSVSRRMPALLLAATTAAVLAFAQQAHGAPAPVSADDAVKIGVEAYVYGYPLVLMDATRRVMTAVPKADGKKAPVNQFVHAREFPDYTFTDVVSPNADTLYSFAWLDLTEEPMVLSVPDVGQRYYVMQMMDAWTNVFASPGSRTTGNRKGAFAIVGPRWTGKLPRGGKMIRSPTGMVWLRPHADQRQGRLRGGSRHPGAV